MIRKLGTVRRHEWINRVNNYSSLCKRYLYIYMIEIGIKPRISL